MDLLKSINDKCNLFSDSEIFTGLKSVTTHIEIAEQHFENGIVGDDYYFTDVIYRCNQAFEGSLKEAYKVFSGKDSNKITPRAIEQYFEKNNILKNRVLTLFTNYRQEWRNESTHNYKLYFSNQEAFLALVNICAFFNILLDEMNFQTAYNREKKDILQNGDQLIETKGKPLIDEVIQILLEFSKTAPSRMKGSTMLHYSEFDLIGSISAYLSSLNDDISVQTEKKIQIGNSRIMPDILVQNDKSSLYVEIKRPTRHFYQTLDSAKNQMLQYIQATEVNEGIIYIPPTKQDAKMIVETFDNFDKDKKIIAIFEDHFKQPKTF
ncbi:hypothetical protein HNV12_11655 [Methanococcoides sp. SA1]|nr:hypothetical protein [Methanococcoides sp. SA1]